MIDKDAPLDSGPPPTEEEIAELRAKVEELKRERRAAVPPRASPRVLRRRAEGLLAKRRKRQRQHVRSQRRRNR